MPNAAILALAGSARPDTFNKKLIRIAARGAEAAGASVTVIDLRDFELPVYDADLEAEKGLPPAAVELRSLLERHQGLLIASPENNGSVSARLKNTIDWSTRSEEAQPDISKYQGKIAALLAASPGGLGGLRGLVHVRAILEMIGCMVIPDQLTVRSAHTAFDEAGELTDERQAKRVEAIGARLAALLQRLGSP